MLFKYLPFSDLCTELTPPNALPQPTTDNRQLATDNDPVPTGTDNFLLQHPDYFIADHFDLNIFRR
jgi:hypothetical protein